MSQLASDPRDGITSLADKAPILLLPVRLETRFSGKSELLVRIYPDDCNISTFDETLTPSEVDNVRRYWTELREAAGAGPGGTGAGGAGPGGAEAGQRAAWRRLVAAHGSGRASWLVAAHRPSNPTGPPVFPDVATKPAAWSRAPQVLLMPQRFVVLGFQTGEETLVEVGAEIDKDLFAGPDPAATGADQLHHDERGNLVMPERLRWLSDFDRAVELGMALRVPLTDKQAERGFDRLLVLGVRLGGDQQDGAAQLADLLRQHAHSRTGVAVVARGTPTNNTEDADSGYGRRDDPDASFDDLREPAYEVTEKPELKRDGQWLAEYLGLPVDSFVHTRGAGGTDQLTARAMNTLLWPATLGYWMRAMMSGVFGDGAADGVRDFFTRHVLGGGVVPAIRIGAQPYGILPATAFSRLEWPDRDPGADKLPGPLYRVLDTIRRDWTPLVDQVSRLGGPAGDPHQTLLDVLALHPGSVEWSQRYAESLTTLVNRLNLQGLAGWIAQVLLAAQRAAARQLLADHGHTGGAVPPILDQVFSGRQNLLSGGVVDGLPASETAPLRPSTVDDRNYLAWLGAAARGGLDRLYEQAQFVDDAPPASLLYLLARHALQLGYHETGVRLYRSSGLYTPAQARAARTDHPILHISAGSPLSESRYQPLFAAAPAITGHQTRRVCDHITMTLGSAASAELAGQLDALDRLEQAPTARLERAFADHIDTCAYRLDAWLLGLVDRQLSGMREKLPTGVHLGAYGLVEDLRPGRRERSEYEPADKDVAEDFDDGPLLHDPANQGFVHTPSLNHAVAAAVLRNGYLSGVAPGEGPSVDLSSARVRAALALVNGVRAGQSLSDLLGYQFERGLHDRHGMAEVDSFILPLRKAFPLRADRLASTRTGDSVPIEAIEAGNVLDGLALVERLRTAAGYPFGAAGLPPASPAQAAAINAEAHRLRDSHDAVADLALAEGVFQAVLGNYDRVASTYDAYAKGTSPTEPDIVRTPGGGVTLTHRVALHLPPSSATPAATPRARIEPAVDGWLAGVLPPLAEIACLVSYLAAGTGDEVVEEVRIEQLGLHPADLVALVRDHPLPELDDRVRRFVRSAFDPRPDHPIEIRYEQAGPGRVSVFELLPLLRAVRRLVSLSRPLAANDLALTADARVADEPAPSIDRSRVAAVEAALRQARTALAAAAGPLAGPELPSNVDEQVVAAVDALASAALFGLPQAGWDFAYEGIGLSYSDLQSACAATARQCRERLDRFAEEFARYEALPAGSSDGQRFLLLGRAEAALTTDRIEPRPASPAGFAAALQAGPVADLEAAAQRYEAVATSTRRTASGLRADILAIPPAAPADLPPPDLAQADGRLSQLRADARVVLLTVLVEADRRLAAAVAAIARHDTATSPAEQVAALQAAATALLGDDCRLVPEFTLDGTRAGEVAAALAASRSGAPYAHLDVDFPVDTWLHATARVREPLRDWEQLQLLAGAFGRPEPALDALQLPPVAGEGWLGLDIRPGQVVDADRLLYTAHLPAGTAPAAPQRGLLLDEWTETIPADTAETGLAFHFDRPNTEAPQAMLLVTPTQERGAWQWDDLVDAVCDTMDLAKLRALEPHHIGQLPYASFLPATLMASQVRQLTIAADLALNNVFSHAQAHAKAQP